MKVIAVILNVCMLGALVMILVLEGFPTNIDITNIIDIVEICIVGLWAGVPIVNLIVISSAIRGLPSGVSWLGLYFERKRLEEQKRIESLKKDRHPE